MNRLIPEDIESFLFELGTFKTDVPGAYEEYARAAASLLFDKYVILREPSLQILPATPRWRSR